MVGRLATDKSHHWKAFASVKSNASWEQRLGLDPSKLMAGVAPLQSRRLANARPLSGTAGSVLARGHVHMRCSTLSSLLFNVDPGTLRLKMALGSAPLPQVLVCACGRLRMHTHACIHERIHENGFARTSQSVHTDILKRSRSWDPQRVFAHGIRRSHSECAVGLRVLVFGIRLCTVSCMIYTGA